MRTKAQLLQAKYNDQDDRKVREISDKTSLTAVKTAFKSSSTCKVNAEITAKCQPMQASRRQVLLSWRK